MIKGFLFLNKYNLEINSLLFLNNHFILLIFKNLNYFLFIYKINNY